MKPENGSPPASPRTSLLQAAMLGGVAAMIIFIVQRSRGGFDADGAGPMLLWHLLFGAGAFAVGAFVRNRLAR